MLHLEGCWSPDKRRVPASTDAAIAEAKSITARSLADPSSVDPTVAIAALNVAARNGDEALFNLLPEIAPDDISLARLLVDNPACLYGFEP